MVKDELIGYYKLDLFLLEQHDSVEKELNISLTSDKENGTPDSVLQLILNLVPIPASECPPSLALPSSKNTLQIPSVSATTSPVLSR